MDERTNVENYEVFFNSIDDFLFVLDEQGNILHVNKTVVDRLGYKEEELKGKSVLFVHPEDRREEAGRIVAEMLAGKVKFCPVPIISKSGVQIPVETKITHGFWDGKPALFGVTKDVSQIKLSEELLRKSEEKYRLISENTSDGIIIFGAKNNIEYVSPSYVKLFGYSEEEELSRTTENLRSIIHPDDAGVVFSNIFKAIELKKDNLLYSYRMKKRDGNYIWREDNARLKYDNYGKYAGAYVVCRDISERKQIENKLKQISERLFLATRAGGVGIWDYDVVNNNLIWDEQMYKLYGITADKFSGAYDAWRSGLYKEDMQRGDDEIQMALRGEKEFNTEFRVVWLDGTIHYIRAIAVVERDETGKPLRMVGTNWDITDNKKNEEQFKKHTEEVEKINKLMIGRELEMVKLKKEIMNLKEKIN